MQYINNVSHCFGLIVSIKVVSFDFNNSTSGIFHKLLDVRGNLLKCLRISITDDITPQFVSILANAKMSRLQWCEVYFRLRFDHTLTIDHLKSLYGIPVHDYLSLHSAHTDHIRNLRDLALKSVANKKCRIQCDPWYTLDKYYLNV